jgi:CheY-like chemotaxis protein
MEPHPTILIVDDDWSYNEALRLIIQEEVTAQVEWLTTGKEALDRIGDLKNNVIVLLDMMVPFTSEDYEGGMPPLAGEEARGIKVLKELQKVNFNLHNVIVVTALAESQHLAPIRGLGFDDSRLLIKPVETIKIIKTLRFLYTSLEKRKL